MINIENKVFNDIATALTTEYPNISVVSEYVDTPNTFPCVTIVEDDNSVHQNSLDNTNVEHHANLMYSVNVYSNKRSGKKQEAKAIMGSIDNLMSAMKFTRTMCMQTPNIDRTIYRITARYTAIVERGRADGDNTVYQIYRR